jgi:precorrin-6A/cobalt-precorrin-6A reductase
MRDTSRSVDPSARKNSGCDATYGKIAAARALGIPVLLIRRPADPGGRRVSDVSEAIACLDQVLGVDAHALGTELDRGV